MDLTSTADVKSLLGITTTTWDTLIGNLVSSVSEFIANYCDRDFALPGTDDTEYYDGYDGMIKTLQLKKYPIASITSISSRIGSFTNPTYHTYDPATQYTFKPESGEVFFVFRLPPGHQNIKVVYKGGYASGSVPKSIQLAAQKLIGKEWLKRSSQGLTNEHVGEVGVNWNENMDTMVEMYLADYIKYSL